MDLDRPAPLLPAGAAEQNIQPIRGGVAGSRLIESHLHHMDDTSEDRLEVQPVMPEKVSRGDFENQRNGFKSCFESFCPLGHGGGDDHIVRHWRDSRHRHMDVELLCKNIKERIAPTMISAKEEKAKYASRATRARYALNAAIGLQVLTGVLTTAISAATSGRQTSILISVLGGLTALLASYLFFVRGSGEPELSNARVKDLEQFLRDCESFTFVHGEEYGAPENELDERIENLRKRFELLLGNNDA